MEEARARLRRELPPPAWVRLFSGIVGTAGLAFGLFSAFWPRRLGWLLIGMNLILWLSLLF